MKFDHKYFTNPEQFYTTQLTKISFANFNLSIQEIQDLDNCIDFQCNYLESSPLPPPYKDIHEDLCPYFAKIWDCAVSLAEWIIQNQHYFNQKKTLEIGAGLAIPSLVLAKLGHVVTATDYHPHTSYFSSLNQELNKINFPYLQKNWNELSNLVPQFDVIIASDILYEGKYISDLSHLLTSCLSPHGIVIICDPVRGYLQKLISQLESNFLINLETTNYKHKEHFLVKMKKPFVNLV